MITRKIKDIIYRDKSREYPKILALDSILIATFTSLSIIIIFVICSIVESKTDEVLENRFESFISQYESANLSTKRHAQYFFEDRVNNESILSLYREIENASKQRQDEIREELYSALNSSYENLKILGFRQFQFHLPNNISFLRFHKKEKYGDDLSAVRYTVEQANLTKKRVFGFEEGRIYNGFRNLFPIIDRDGKHLGSVEVSISYSAFKEEISRISGIYVDFMIKKELVNQKVWEEERGFYVPSNIHSDYLSEKDSTKDRAINSSSIDKSRVYSIAKKLSKEELLKISNGEAFATYVTEGNSGVIAMFLPVANAKGDRAASYLHAYIQSNVPLGIKRDYRVMAAIIILIIGVILFVARLKVLTDYKIRTQKEELEQSEIELREINNIMADQIEYEVASKMNAQRLYTTIFENSPLGVLSIDENGHFLHANKSALETIGYSLEELLEKSVVDISPDIQPETDLFSQISMIEIIKSVLKGEVRSFEWTHVHKDGSIIVFDVLLASSPTNKKEIMVFWKDITEMKMLENERKLQDAILIQQSKHAELGEMIAAIAHQWKQPLNALSLYAQMIFDDIEYKEATDERMIEIGELIEEQIAYMNQTVNDFKNFLSPKKTKESFLPCESIDGTLRIIKHLLIKSSTTYTLHQHEHFSVFGIKNEFQQVVMNIVKNAIDNMEDRDIEDRRVDVYTTKDEKNGTIKICDSGGGIADSLLPDMLFEPYITTKGEKGTGLGLSLVKRIIESNFGGSIRAYNIEDGACIEIVLPLYKDS